MGKNNQRIFQRILCGALCVFVVGIFGVVNAQNNDFKTTTPSLSNQEITNLNPTYPHMSRRLGEQGTVVLRVLVISDGTIGAAEVESSSSFPRLDQAAIDAVKMISNQIKCELKFQIFFENSRKFIRLAQIYNISKNNNA